MIRKIKTNERQNRIINLLRTQPVTFPTIQKWNKFLFFRKIHQLYYMLYAIHNVHCAQFSMLSKVVNMHTVPFNQVLILFMIMPEKVLKTINFMSNTYDFHHINIKYCIFVEYFSLSLSLSFFFSYFSPFV